MVSIKSEREIALMREAGHYNYLTHEEMKKHLKPGVTTEELDKICYDFCIKNDCYPSCLHYEGYPKSVCISINDEVVHGIPSKRKIKNGDIVSIDVGVISHGYHSDAAETVAVGSINKQKEHLIKHTEAALRVGIREVKAGAKLGNVSARIQSYAEKHGLGVVRELVGHGVGRDLHEDPDVPNYGKYGSGITLKEGMIIAIEPMLTAGKRYVRQLSDDWTIVTSDGQPSAHFEHTVLVTKDGYEILTGE